MAYNTYNAGFGSAARAVGRWPALLLLCCCCLPECLLGQARPPGILPVDVQGIRQRNLILVNQGGLAANAGENQEPAAEEGAPLKTDPDLESVLEKADRYRQDGNYSLAAQLWQIVLQRSGDTLFSNDGRTYFSMVDQVENILAGLPAEGLAIYRINADAAARQILARAAGSADPQALSEVVRLYFISSIGDDAAFQLACLYLDQFDFVGALRLLRKIQQQHPDSSIPPVEIDARLVLCQVMVGDLSGAEQTLAELGAEVQQSGSRGWQLSQLLAQVRNGQATSLGALGLGGFRHFRVQPLTVEPQLSTRLTCDWQVYVEPSNNARNHPEALRVLDTSTDALTRVVADTVTSNEHGLVEAWLAAGWQPAGVPLFRDGQVVWKSPHGISAWSVAGGHPNSPDWRSAWLNQFEPDDATKAMQTIQRMYDSGPRVNNSAALNQDYPVQIFGDRIHSQLAMLDGVIYSLEGRRYDPALGGNNRPVNPQRGFQFNTTFRRTRTNTLVAYDAASGKALWSLPAEKEATDPATAEAATESPFLLTGGFMSVPVQFGDTLIAPINQSGAIYLYAFDPRDSGRTIWKTYLCDEPETGANAWSPIQLTLEGSDLFVASGMGVVFVVDPATGMVRFAQRYERIGKRNNALRQFQWQVNRMDFNGWSEDIIIPYGRQMICFVSDSNRIFAFDRNTGKLIWETDMNPLGNKVDYLLGIHGDTLYAGGSQTLIAFDLAGEGRMLWGGENMFGNGRSFGHGFVSNNAIYLPVNDSIWQYSLWGKNGQPEKLAEAHVDLLTGAPVGNLSSDGQNFWVQQGTRLVRLRSAETASGNSEQGSD